MPRLKPIGHPCCVLQPFPVLNLRIIEKNKQTNKQQQQQNKKKHTKKNKFRLLREFILETEVLYTPAQIFQNLTKIWLFIVPEQPKKFERNTC